MNHPHGVAEIVAGSKESGLLQGMPAVFTGVRMQEPGYFFYFFPRHAFLLVSGIFPGQTVLIQGAWAIQPLPVATVVKIVPPASHRGRYTTPECIPVVRPIRELTIEVLF